MSNPLDVSDVIYPDVPLTNGQMQELYSKTLEIHDFVETLKQLGIQFAQSDHPMLNVVKNMIPSGV